MVLINCNSSSSGWLEWAYHKMNMKVYALYPPRRLGRHRSLLSACHCPLYRVVDSYSKDFATGVKCGIGPQFSTASYLSSIVLLSLHHRRHLASLRHPPITRCSGIRVVSRIASRSFLLLSRQYRHVHDAWTPCLQQSRLARKYSIFIDTANASKPTLKVDQLSCFTGIP